MIINVYNTQLEKDLAHELDNFITKEGCELIRIRINKNRSSGKCQIMIEKIDNQQVTIKDCEKVHKAILQISKKNSLGLDDHYDIEVSSSGVDKPLTRLKDYIAAKEKLVKIYALYKIENRRNFKGYLKDVDKDSVKIQLLNKSDVVNLNFEAISEAYLQYEF